jgi:hypothetical protein
MKRDKAKRYRTAVAQADEVMALVEAVRPLFKGKAPEVQGAALADLLAMWLAGHFDANDPESAATEQIRETMLELHLRAVRDLIPVNYLALIEPQLPRRR